MSRPLSHALASAVACTLLAASVVSAQDAGRSHAPPSGSLATSTIWWHLDSACTAGALAACDTIGMHYRATGKKGDLKAAAELWQTTCAVGGAGACANLAMAYDGGAGVKRDARRAATLAQQACDAGAAPGCVAFASMLSDGRGGHKDVSGGAALMEQACTMKDFYACLNMAERALDGLFGVARDTNRARVFYGKACAAVVPQHPYPWYRTAADEACAKAGQLGTAPPN